MIKINFKNIKFYLLSVLLVLINPINMANETTDRIKKISHNHITYGATSTNYMGVPLNAYGAVSASAKVPLTDQVPPVPKNLKLSIITPVNILWKDEIIPAPMLNIPSYILLDANTGNILAAKNPHLRIAPASLTKMMLIYIVEKHLASGNLNLEQEVTIPAIAWHTSGSTMHLQAGQKVTVQELLKGVIVASGNDASVALAILIAGTQESFVNIMNFTAKKLGMTNTHFSNVMGLPSPNLYSSAHDLGILARHLIYDYPEYYNFFKIKTVSINNVLTKNYNKLLDTYSYADGIKTGFTKSSGYSLVSSAIKKNHPRLIAIVLGANSLIQSVYDSQSLLEYGFSNFQTNIFYPASYQLDKMKVYKGENNDISIGVSKVINISFPKEIDPEKLKFILHKNKDPLIAPINLNTTIGKLDIIYQGKVRQSFPVVTLEKNKEGSLYQIIKDNFSLFFHKIFA